MDEQITCSTHTVVGHKGSADKSVRVFGIDPDSTGLQIRSVGPTAPSQRGVSKPAYSTAFLSLAGVDELIDALVTERARLARNAVQE